MSAGSFPRLFTQNRSSAARSNGRVSWFLFTCVFVLMEGLVLARFYRELVAWSGAVE